MQNINSDLIRGNIDTIILKTMQDGDMYGLDIIREVESKSNGTYELKQPTLYSCLKRLENKEYISSYWLDSEIGGKRHYYKLTDKGREVIQAKQDEWSKSKLLIDNLLGDFDFDEYRLVKKDDYDKIINGKPVIQYVEVEKQVLVPVESNNVINQQNNSNQPSNITTLNNEVVDDNNLEMLENSLDEENLPSETNDNLDADDIESLNNNLTDNSSIDDTKNYKPDIFNNDLIYFKPKSNANPSINDNNNAGINQSLQIKQSNVFESNNTQIVNSISNQSSQQSQSSPIIPEKKAIQQDLFSEMLLPYQIEVDNSISEFNSNISLLNKINSSDDDISNIIEKQNELPSQNKPLDDNPSETLTETETQEPVNESPVIEENTESKNYHTIFKKDSLLNELNQLNNNEYNIRDISFENDDGYDFKYDENVKPLPKNPQPQQNYTTSNLNTQNNSINYKNTQTPETLNTSFNDNREQNFQQNSYNDNRNYNTTNNYAVEKIVDKNYDQQLSGKESIDEIIYKNVTEYTNENSREFIENTLSHYTTTTDDGYKQKISNIVEYAKESYPNEDDVRYSKDIHALKEEYKTKGIVIKEFNKEDSFKLKKNYLIINKLNLIKSVILLFGYVFVLSALFIIMDSTSLKNMHDFSFKFFLIGFIPFIVYTIYYLIIYLLNPYKKIPMKRSPKILFFISIIMTIQLLLITYCLNLQMGFYSFSQEGYNHLFWIIPTIISFAPICSTIIYCGLCRSKNFNI